MWIVRRFQKFNLTAAGTVVFMKVMKAGQLMSQLMLLTTSLIYLRKKSIGQGMVTHLLLQMTVQLLTPRWHGNQKQFSCWASSTLAV